MIDQNWPYILVGFVFFVFGLLVGQLIHREEMSEINEKYYLQSKGFGRLSNLVLKELTDMKKEVTILKDKTNHCYINEWKTARDVFVPTHDINLNEPYCMDCTDSTYTTVKGTSCNEYKSTNQSTTISFNNGVDK